MWKVVDGRRSRRSSSSWHGCVLALYTATVQRSVYTLSIIASIMVLSVFIRLNASFASIEVVVADLQIVKLPTSFGPLFQEQTVHILCCRLNHFLTASPTAFAGLMTLRACSYDVARRRSHQAAPFATRKFDAHPAGRSSG